MYGWEITLFNCICKKSLWTKRLYIRPIRPFCVLEVVPRECAWALWYEGGKLFHLPFYRILPVQKPGNLALPPQSHAPVWLKNTFKREKALILHFFILKFLLQTNDSYKHLKKKMDGDISVSSTDSSSCSSLVEHRKTHIKILTQNCLFKLDKNYTVI